ncbi:hypothetical protein DFS34DRAFT_649391 [Phlyctochytrium arcticum]|nr:hypothetical protein DFS34DRAFT_649391 [Phlyctochytrium arcticum]
MRKIPANETAAGRSSPTLAGPTTPGTKVSSFWGSGSSASNNRQSSSNSEQGGRDNNAGLGWGGTPTTPSGTLDNSPYRYSREFILSLYDAALPPPGDFLPGAAVISEEPLPPMANIPLNDKEKTLFTSQSVNSEISARRTPYRADSKDGIRPPRPPANVQRTYSGRTDRTPGQEGYRPRRADAYGNDEDPWDTPAGVGSFGGNGFFSQTDEELRSVGRTPADTNRENSMLLNTRGRESPERSGSPSPRADYSDPSSVRGNRSASPGKQHQAHPDHSANPLANSILGRVGIHGNADEDLGRPITSRSSSYVDMFGSLGPSVSAANRSLGRNTPELAPGMTRSMSKGDMQQNNSSALPPPGIPAAMSFVPQQWQYRDPSGNVQGPFTAQQMQEWFRSGYFSDDLPIKRLDDYNYEPLARLIHAFGRDHPFLADLEDSEQRFQQMEQQRRFTGRLGLSSGYKDIFPPDVTTPSSLGYNAFGGAFGSGTGTPALFTPTNVLSNDPFSALPRDRFGSNGYDPVGSSSFNRTSWNETQSTGRAGWNGLNTDLASPFSRPMAPMSPIISKQTPGPGAYFDSRHGQDSLESPVHQRPTSSFPSFAAQTQSLNQAPQSPVANLFSSQPVLDFGGPSSHRNHSGWSNFDNLGNSNEASRPFDDGDKAADAVSRLIGEVSLEPERKHIEEPKAAPIDQHLASSRSEAKNVAKDPVSPTKVTPTEPSVPTNESSKATTKAASKARKARQEQSERKADVEQASEPVKPSTPAADLRKIMSEQETRSKREREQMSLEKSRLLELELQQERQRLEEEEEQQKPKGSAWASGATDQPKLSLKEIQDMEQARHEKAERERQRRAHELLMQEAQHLQEQGALSQNTPWAKDNAGGQVWAATTRPQPTRQKSLAEIMQEEEVRKRKEEIRMQNAEAAVPVAPTGKRYADSAAGQPTSMSWGLASAAARPASSTRPAAVVASNNVVKAATPQSSTSRPDETATGAWNVVGKQGQVVRPPAPVVRPVAPPPAIRSVPRVVPAPAAPVSMNHSNHSPQPESNKHSPSTAFMQWCRSALNPLERSTSAGVKVDDFVGILLSISISDQATLQMICDDTLGGLTAIDPHKFADEFSRRRKADASGISLASEGWTSVGSGAAPGLPTATLETFDSGNKFVMVGKGSKKKKGKK